RHAIHLPATRAAHFHTLMLLQAMIRPASSADLPRIRELFARANDMPYDLAVVAEEKCFSAGVAGDPVVRVYGEFEGVSVTCGDWLRILAVDRARRGRGVGTALLRDAESRGITGIAAEAGNYFTPGVLEEQTRFFEKCGFHETARTQNLETSELPDHGQLPTTARSRVHRKKFRPHLGLRSRQRHPLPCRGKRRDHRLRRARSQQSRSRILRPHRRRPRPSRQRHRPAPPPRRSRRRPPPR